jgi:peptidyl-prolyl cis-trans isomerase D
MMRFLRSQSQTVLVVIMGVIALGFLFYGSAGTNLISAAGGRPNDYGRIDGDDVSVAQLYDAVRSTRQAAVMSGQSEKLRQPGADREIAEDAWRQLLLAHEADRLHITISDQEVVDRIKTEPIFQKNGAFDPEVYKTQLKTLQFLLHVPTDGGVDPTAATEATFEKLIRDGLRSAATQKALFDSVRGSAADVTDKYDKYYGPATLSYVVFDPKALAGTVPVTPADIEAEYKDHPTNPAYRTKEKRKVDYVLFLLTPDQLKLPADQKAKAKDALGQKALEFALTFQPDPSVTPSNATTTPDFEAQAKLHNLTAVTTDFFTDDSPPSGLPPSPSFNSAAFALTKDNPISKVVELDNGVAVIRLDEIQPSQLRPLDEVKADIAKQLQQSKSLQAAQAQAMGASVVLKAAVSKGTDFKTAAAGMKLAVTTAPAFVPIKAPPGDPKLQTLAYASISLKPGAISDPIPVESDGSVIVAHLDTRAPADPKGLADFETRYRQQQDDQIRSLAFVDWAEWKSKQPGTHKPPDLEAYGSVE